MTFKTSIAAIAVAAALSTAAMAQEGEQDIVDTAAEAGQFETLLAAAEAAGLVETLKGDGPFTVFAPTDDAFAELGSTVDELLQPENSEQLTAILTYHVVSGSVMSTDLEDDATAATVEGSDVTFNLDDGPMVNDANIVTADVAASNGVIHVIDKVLMPETAM